MTDDRPADEGVPSPPPPTQFDSVEDGQVVRAAAEQVRRYSAISSSLEVVLVALVALSLLGIGYGLYQTAQTNRRGVERIVSCTTPGEDCFEDQQVRTNDLVGEILIQLNHSHQKIECLLAELPEKRGPEDSQRCHDEATTKTQAELEKLRQQIRERSNQARRNGP